MQKIVVVGTEDYGLNMVGPAHAFGMHAIHFSGDYEQLKQNLRQYDILLD